MADFVREILVLLSEIVRLLREAEDDGFALIACQRVNDFQGQFGPVFALDLRLYVANDPFNAHWC
jgi:hypothetical protein